MCPGDSFPFRRCKDTTLKLRKINSTQLRTIVVGCVQL
ncbi:hypothetical protein BOVA604_1516 [Bacteroides ovatus]|nr:hypothetical protein BOVA604_1516 [Bacteroides ovatus]